MVKFGVQLGWNTQASAYQNIQAQRASMARYLGSAQSSINAVGSALAGAATNQITGLANIAAQRAMNRIKAQLQTVMMSRDKQLADAQATLQATQKTANSTPSLPGSVLNMSA